MKFTVSWLKDHLETEASLEDILETLTVIGLEVEDVANPAERLKDFVIAKVISAEQHPDADKLRLCQVDNGSETVQVVCGAHNAKTGMTGVFAPVGTYVPGIDLTLKKAKIRGVESNGMLCSERELEISDEHDGIIELDTDAKPGTSFVKVAGLDDPVIEIAITPNRPDCLAVYGIARDLAAAGLGTLKNPKIKTYKGEFSSPVSIELKFNKKTADACPVFYGRYIRNVTNRPSPYWMQQRLKAVGLRPINALVDITNYISYDRARPLHVYDADKLKGAIHARLGKANETFLALDGKDYEVDTEMCVIADDSGVLGFGGIMGGETTGCTEKTKNVFIESAYFDPIRTATTGRKTGIISDARYRFERGIDPQSVNLGIDLATELILETCQGTPSDIVKAGTPPKPNVTIDFNTNEIKRLTGEALKQSDIKKSLVKLGFSVAGKGTDIEITAPTWRPDIHQSADIIEEVIRLHGVDKVKAIKLPDSPNFLKPVLTTSQVRVRKTRRLLASRGLTEAVTWSFIPPNLAKQFSGGQKELELANPISTEMSSMRPTLIAGLLTAVGRNHDRGFTDVAIFEIGQTYKGDTPEDQLSCAAGLRSGTAKLNLDGRHWDGMAHPVNSYDAKADILSVLQIFGQDQNKIQVSRDVPNWLHPGRSACLKLGPKIKLGIFGEVHPKILKSLDIDQPVVAFEIYLNAIPEPKRKTTAKTALENIDLQPVKRDFAFLLDKDSAAQDVIRAALGADKKFITDVNIFDIYDGKGIDENKKSLAIEVTLQPREKTFTEDDIEAISNKIVAQVKKATGGEIRG